MKGDKRSKKANYKSTHTHTRFEKALSKSDTLKSIPTLLNCKSLTRKKALQCDSQTVEVYVCGFIAKFVVVIRECYFPAAVGPT